MYSPVPNGGQGPDMVGSDEGSDSSSNDGDGESGDDSGSEEVEEVSPPRTEGRFKQQHDPALDRGRAGGSTARGSKRSRASTPEPTEKVVKQPKAMPEPTEKVVKQPKVTTNKPRKALPRIIAAVPIVST